MSRLPVSGSDNGQWGQILNDFLLQSHDADGTLKLSAVSSAMTPGSLTRTTLDSSTQASLARADTAPVLLMYDTNSNSYPTRPSGLAAGWAIYRGPTAPTDAITPDVWEDTSGIWP